MPIALPLGPPELRRCFAASLDTVRTLTGTEMEWAARASEIICNRPNRWTARRVSSVPRLRCGGGAGLEVRPRPTWTLPNAVSRAGRGKHPQSFCDVADLDRRRRVAVPILVVLGSEPLQQEPPPDGSTVRGRFFPNTLRAYRPVDLFASIFVFRR